MGRKKRRHEENKDHAKKPIKWKKKTALAAGALAALALGLGLRWGSGQGNGTLERGNGPSEDTTIALASMQPTPESIAATPDASKQTEDEKRIIEVREDAVFIEGEEIPMENLRENLLRIYKEGEVWGLRDNRAKKHPYDAVKSVLQDLSIQYIELQAE